MKELFFENPYPLIIFLLVLEFIIFLFFKKDFTKKRVKILLIIPFLIPLLTIIAKYVETDKEQILKNLNIIERYIQNGEFDNFKKFIHSEFLGKYKKNSYNKDQLIDEIKTRISKVGGLKQFSFRSFKFKFKSDSVELICKTEITFFYNLQLYNILLKWKIIWKKENGIWKFYRTKNPEQVLF